MSRASIRRTKIVATLGPSWDQPAQMTALLNAGVDVIRINASHGTPEIRSRWVTQLRGVLQGAEAAAVLLDLQGPLIRIGNLSQPIRLESGQRVVVAPKPSPARARSRPPTTISRGTCGSVPEFCSTMACSRWKCAGYGSSGWRRWCITAAR